MRAMEFIQEDVTPSKPVTLRSLHKIKHEQRHQRDIEAERRLLMQIMYGIDNTHEAELDLLDQRRRQSEKNQNVVRKMAKSGIAATKKSEARLNRHQTHYPLTLRCSPFSSRAGITCPNKPQS